MCLLSKRPKYIGERETSGKKCTGTNIMLQFDRYAPNISVRINRLQTILSKKCPQIVISMSSRGQFKINTSAFIEFHEV